MTTTEIIKSLEDQARDKDLLASSDDPECIFIRDAQALREAAEFIRTRQDQLTNAQLTLEELREMDGEPVWCVCGSGRKCWAIVNWYGDEEDDFECDTKNFERIPGWCYGMDGMAGWIAYRRKPEDGTV